MAFMFSPEEILEMAIKIEDMGLLYYETFAKKTKDKKVSEIFQFLAGEEAKHKVLFTKMYEEFKKEDFFTPYNYEEVSAYFNALIESRFFIKPDAVMKIMDKVDNENDAIENAITFEKDTILYFHELGSMVKEKNKELIQRLITEEKNHVMKLVELKLSLGSNLK